MELFGLLAVVLSTVIAAASSAVANSQNMQNAEQLQNSQQQYNHDEAWLANERALSNYFTTEAPAAKVQQLKDAGLSVSMMYGGTGAGGGVTAGTQAQAGMQSAPVVNPVLGQGLNDMFQNLKTMADTENTKEDTDKKKQEIENMKSEIDVNNATIEKIATDNNLTNVRVLNEAFDGQMKQIELQIAQATANDKIKIVAQTANQLENANKKLLEEIKGLEIDNDNKQKMYDAQLRKYSAEISLIWKQHGLVAAQTQLADAHKNLAGAQSALAGSQVQLNYIERQIKWKDLERADTLTAQINAQIALWEKQGEKIELEKVTEVLHWMEQLSGILNNRSKRFNETMQTVGKYGSKLIF